MEYFEGNVVGESLEGTIRFSASGGGDVQNVFPFRAAGLGPPIGLMGRKGKNESMTSKRTVTTTPNNSPYNTYTPLGDSVGM
jgi:hypothetical protein